ncbi:MAG: hypothetical protein J7K48_03190 [Thermococcus sp.]|nr:hypothetical protein [Thermococcus sp.]
MIEPKYDPQSGVWKCPICGWTAMSRKVVASHIQREHSDVLSPSSHQKPTKKRPDISLSTDGTPQNGNRNLASEKTVKKKSPKRLFKIGNTTIKLWDNPLIEVREFGGWRYFQNRNYVAALHGKRVKVTLIDGRELEGRLGAKDPYFIKLEISSGRKILINKGAIMLIEPLSGGD